MYLHVQIHICNELLNKFNELTENREDLLSHIRGLWERNIYLFIFYYILLIMLLQLS